MLIGNKFWPIDAPANYAPSAHPRIAVYADSNGTTIISGLGTATIAAMNAIGAANLGIAGPGVTPGDVVAQIGDGLGGGSDITMTTALSSTLSAGHFFYWDKRYPAAGNDQPIQAVLCLDSTHADFEFIDANGSTVFIPGSTLAKGAVYYFGIGEVTDVTSGDFIGYSTN